MSSSLDLDPPAERARERYTEIEKGPKKEPRDRHKGVVPDFERKAAEGMAGRKGDRSGVNIVIVAVIGREPAPRPLKRPAADHRRQMDNAVGPTEFPGFHSDGSQHIAVS
ncbi:hypothetical protein KM043_006001 [Ampulex compressa]|nr:hypothetical protein KM043_006001 [Ampulex compressa]